LTITVGGAVDKARGTAVERDVTLSHVDSVKAASATSRTGRLLVRTSGGEVDDARSNAQSTTAHSVRWASGVTSSAVVDVGQGVDA